jgi:hypothetical protein
MLVRSRDNRTFQLSQMVSVGQLSNLTRLADILCVFVFLSFGHLIFDVLDPLCRRHDGRSVCICRVYKV